MVNFKLKLRKESSAQFSGNLPLSKIPILKERNYHIVDVPLDGEAPKQYIKAYFYYPNCPRISSPDQWDGYYAKFGGKSYPHESIVEFAINKIGEGLGLKMNETQLAVINGQVRFLSKDFLKKGQRLIHGIEILAEYLEDKEFVEEINEDKKNRREYLTFDVIEQAIKHVYPKEESHILTELIKMITFDALAGNNDRHFYNWGVIGDTAKGKKTGVVFAPVYDSARGLFWNHTQDRLLKLYKGYKTSSKQVESYLKKSEPRFSCESNPKANHFQLIEFLVKYDNKYKDIVTYLCTEEKENCVYSKLDRHVFSLFSHERKEIMKEILRLRFNIIRGLVK